MKVNKVAIMAIMVLVLSTALFIEGSSQTIPITIGTSGSAGTYGIVGAAFSTVINQYSNGLLASVYGTPGGGNANARFLQRYELEFGLTTLMAGVDGWNGEGAFIDDPEKLRNLRSVLLGASSLIHVIVNADSPITKIQDLKGKKIASVSASSHTIAIPILLKAYGIGMDEYQGIQLSTSEAIDQFKDKNIDAIASGILGPAASIQDLSMTHDIRFLPIESSVIESIVTSVPYFKRGTLKAEWYKGLIQDIPTLSMPILFATNDKVSEEIVYEFVKTILEHNKELAEIHPTAALYSPEEQQNWLSGNDELIPPLHPGAEKYFKEKGWKK